MAEVKTKCKMHTAQKMKFFIKNFFSKIPNFLHFFLCSGIREALAMISMIVDCSKKKMQPSQEFRQTYLCSKIEFWVRLLKFEIR